ncbi:beta-lactamase-like protein [Bisporella sp. PMI_857]|nr:beta-lactamase-like protein [Bisporella sp. PMI_857]
MSTFGGFMPEFPDIRVDYFRQSSGHRPPLACFLSHIHSDHLTGLDNLKSPFVYCSAATRELLLRLERYGHRLNFAKGILEARKLQYKHLNKLLKAVPLETPTRIELEPGNEIQVTLFDANHCTGAVMILLEDGSKAILYTGDIRSEPWFVNSLVRNPFLIEYTSGLKKLDCLYLDTSNTRPIKFPTKAEGLKELLLKVSQYPPDTVFHFAAWTFGYEEIHVDDYKLKLYQSLRGSPDLPSSQFLPNDGRVLTGYICGNTAQAGFLTNNTNARIHSCEKGMQCANVNEKTVWIRPIIARTLSGVEIGEIGIGGGGDDLSRNPELDLENDCVIDQFLGL